MRHLRLSRRTRFLCAWNPCPRYALLLLFLLSTLDQTSLAQRFEAHLYDQNDGLENMSVTTVAQQADGHLWVGTQNGVFRFDGSVFTEFGAASGLTDQAAYSMAIDRTGTLWVGTHSGLFWLEGQRFHELRLNGASLHIGMNSMLAVTSTGELIAQAPPIGIVSIRKESGGWTAQPYGRRHPGFVEPEDTNGIAVDAADRLWFGCDDGLCTATGKGPGKGVRRFGIPEGVPKDYYVSLFLARSGQMWARGRRHLIEWLPGDDRITDRTAAFPAGAFDTVNRGFIEDKWGRILTPTARGFATWDGHSWVDTQSTGEGSLDGASVLFSDREGAVWVGTQGFGLFQSRGYGYWDNYGTAEGLTSPAVLAIAEDAVGRTWLGHNLGANLLAPGGRAAAPSPLAGHKDASVVISLAPGPDGGMWAATELGHLFHVTAQGSIDFHTLLDMYMHRIRLDGSGRLWMATSDGIYTLDRTALRSGQPQAFPSPLLQGKNATDLLIDPSGTVWVAARSGLFRIDGRTATHIAVPGLPDSMQRLTNVARAGDGTLWLAGQMPGIAHVAIEGGTARILKTYARPELASDLVEFLEMDARGRLWIGSDHGVNVLAGGTMYLLTDQDGLIWNLCNEKAFLAARDGSVWIGTARGVSHLQDPAPVLQRPPFAAAIEEAQYDGKEFGPGATVPWNGSPTILRFSALTFRDHPRLIYHYRLKGFVKEPFTTTVPATRLHLLQPGHYELRVVAEDPGHRMFSSPAVFAFTLAPPWWRTRAFHVLLGLAICAALCALGTLAWHWRHRVLLAQQRRLEALIDERTHELELMATHDALTGLLNRRAILAMLDTELQHARRHKEDLCVALIDLDHFKHINDAHGHLAGDHVLREAARRLAAGVRGSDAVGRYGGEEFLVVFRNARQLAGLDRCEHLREILSCQPVAYAGKRLTITCSIGFACDQGGDRAVAELLARADQALYKAKHRGRNRVECAADEATVESAPSAVQPMDV